MLEFLFYLSVFSLSLGQLSSLTKSSGLNIYFFDIVIAVFVFAGIIYFLLSKRLIVSKNLILFLAFCTFGVISLIKPAFTLSFSQFVVSALYLVRFTIYILAGVVTHNLLVYGYLTKKKIFRALILSGIFIAIAGFIQLIVLPDFATLDAVLGWDPHKNRLASTFFDPNFTGGYLALIFALLLHLILVKDNKTHSYLFSNKFLVSNLVVISLAIFLTFSRSAWAMTAIIVFIYGVFKSKYLLFLALVVAFLAYFAVPRVQTRISKVTDPTDSAHFRLISWKNTISIVSDNILIGVGFNTFRYAQSDYGFFDTGTTGGNSGAGSDSSFLLVLATTGVFGFIIFVLAYLFPLFEALQKNSAYKLLILATLLGVFVQSQFINVIFYSQILFVLALFLILDS